MNVDIQLIIAAVIAILGYILAYLKDKEITNVQDFFDPISPVVEPPKNTPKRSYNMSEGVKTFLLAGHVPQEQVDMMRQIDEAEAAGKIDYQVRYTNGFYLISYGQIAGGAGPGKN